ncbi:nitroreductase family deazaflavin-dependent oxidoreductase [Actinospica sp. MGRD01-02]|uniref:Nitroreductase family deazaflavin-dependent oxidoreductase n=1 Tax=Actinospica acidithermotolerans TaxID=2828514 RepID=A0A941EEI1_9ACTN|nr:nitroreductase family deazaflavin-dependent oxidoreductase [Actinospica acidithermotolerans]MBR7827589.1 nitroreductase family deazaflavin-dependent oxidoreductase [Actinospica acidithermotolerans]
MSGTAYDEGAVVDSPTEWVNSHIQQYVASDGAEGHEFRNGAPILLLSVLGRKSGVWRRSALIYGRSGDAYVVVASKGGAPAHPAWFTNLVAEPMVHVQVKGEEFAARARVAEGDERARLWDLMAEIWPDYNQYQTKTDREIPVVVLDPVEG